MNNSVRGEMIVVLNSEEIDPEPQIIILARAAKFLNNEVYTKEIKEKLDPFFVTENINFWIELPKIISVIIEHNKKVVGKDEINVDDMRYVLYVIVYSYLDENQSILLNKLDQGDLRIGLLNILYVLLIKPKLIKVAKQSLFQILFNCVCGDDGMIKLK